LLPTVLLCSDFNFGLSIPADFSAILPFGLSIPAVFSATISLPFVPADNFPLDANLHRFDWAGRPRVGRPGR
jgi:hypothetical protein